MKTKLTPQAETNSNKDKISLSNNTPLNNQRGATMIEYVFLVSIMAVGCIAAVGVMRQGVHDVFQKGGVALGAGGILPDAEL